MFDAVRNNKRIVQVFLALITLPFAFWGVESYVRDAGAGGDLAAVGETKITQQEFQETLREQQDQLRNALGPNFNPAMLDNPEVRRSLLEQLINRRLLLIEANRLRVSVGDSQLQSVIAQVPELQENGKFSMSKYETMLRGQGYTQAGFEARLRQDLSVQQIAGAVSESSLASKNAAASLLAILAETRQVSEFKFLPEAFVAQVKLGDEDLSKYYEANKKVFEEPEQVRAEFVTLSLEALREQATVAPEEAKKWYDTHLDRFVQPEERRASHILITAEASAADDIKSKAKAKAEDLLKQIRANPADFGKLAKQHSQDPGSAEKAGDLGFFSRGMMVKAFEDTVFGLKDGEVSEVVATDFGYHIIKLTGIKPGKQKSFDEVRGEIEAELKQQAVQRKYAEAAETFSNMVYEQADSLKPVIDKFKLSAQQTSWIVKGAPAQPGSPFANPRLQEALFAADAVKEKRNTQAVEVAPTTLVAARVLEHKPAAVRPFAQVKDEIRALQTRAAAAALAVKAGEAKLAELQAGKGDGVTFAAAKPVSRLAPAGLPAPAVQAIFKAATAKLPSYAGVSVGGGGYALYKIVAVDTAAKPDERQEKALRSEYANVLAQEEFAAYLAALRARYKVDINKAALETKER